LDIGLPSMDGFEVARRLRTVPTLEDVFVVAMTGYGSEDDRRAGKAAGFDEYLVKPVDLDRLRAWLRSLPAKTSETT
ncbi:MAG: response regulator, partial [Verrucomicrobiota bacterium]|nr:response regulator [Verrucomicrobiota bacterium]